MDKIYILNGTAKTIAVLLVIMSGYCGIVITITIVINGY